MATVASLGMSLLYLVDLLDQQLDTRSKRARRIVSACASTYIVASGVFLAFNVELVAGSFYCPLMLR